MDIKGTDFNKTSNGTIASKISKERLNKIGDFLTLYNRGNFLIDNIKSPFFTLTWIALLLEYFKNAFSWDIPSSFPILLAIIIIPLNVLIALIDKKWLGIWKRQYYYELKQVNPYFEERFDDIQCKVKNNDEKINKLVEQLRNLIKLLENK